VPAGDASGANAGIGDSDCVSGNDGVSNDELEGQYDTREPNALLSAGVPDMYQGKEGCVNVSFNEDSIIL
jgi:hypothetical protein